MLTTSRSFELASSKAGVTPLKSQQQESDKKAAPSIPVLYDLLIEYECLINSASFISDYLVMSLIRLNSTLCWLIPDWFRRKAHYFTQCLLLMRQGVLFNYLLFNHHLKQNQIMEDLGKKIAHYMITSSHYCVVDISCSFLSSYLQSNDGLKRKDFYRQRWSSLQVFHFSK